MSKPSYSRERLRRQSVLFVVGTLSCVVAWSAVIVRLHAEPPAAIVFNRDVRPLMSDTCFKCHGPGKQEGELRLDDRDAALRRTSGGEVPIVPGQPDQSAIIRRIFSNDPNEVMPPPSTNKVLTAEQKATLRRWVAEGAPYQKHWSFEPILRAPLPALDATAARAARGPLDLFILARLQKEHWSLAELAERTTQLRRAAFTLTGLPPSLDELDMLAAESGPDAYERLVDRYLASPRFGEEFARHWLDVARYGDTHGLHLDNERQMWLYRDWVVRAFNADLPFDEFTIEQLAGDLLENPSSWQLIATGFNRCNVTTGEGGSIDDEWIFRNAVDRTSTMVEAWMGLTGGCCVCHDHKFDPVSAKDFYSLYAFFLSAADPPLDGNTLLTAPTTRMMLPEQQSQIEAITAKMAEVQKQLDTIAAGLTYVDPASQPTGGERREVEQFWVDDEFPTGSKPFASPGHPTQWVTAADSAPVFRGKRALKRTDKGLAQDVYEGQAPPLILPAEAKLFAYVWLDPKDLPKTIMLQYHKGGWLHRAVWGDYQAIDWGKPNTTERVHLGPLPAAGEWVRLEFEASKLGLQPGDGVTGLALTQFGGTVYWDAVGVRGRTDPAADPRHSFRAWWKQQTGKDTPGVPNDLNSVLKAGPEKSATPEHERRLRDYYVQQICADTRTPFERPLQELTQLRQQREAIDKSVPASFIFKDLEKPRDAFVMLRGQYNKPGEKIEPSTPAIFPPLKTRNQRPRADRLDLARWLVSPEHPLTARVTVNRFWQQVFGVGLVKTSFDFGSQGETPSHPELLDWLASTYQRDGWDTKELIRDLVTSATFRQATRVTAERIKLDPENRLYARGPRLRLDAEQLRDNALALGGLLVGELGGRGVKPYQPANIWEPVGFVGSNTSSYVQDHGAALYRRSIYTFFKRTAPPPFMANFDAPNREQFCARRDRSNTPLQALQLLNDTQHFEAARGLAQRMLTEGGANAAERITWSYRTILGRSPRPAELAVVQSTLERHLNRYKTDVVAAQQVINQGESKPRGDLPSQELAAYTLVANLLLNLDETVNRN